MGQMDNRYDRNAVLVFEFMGCTEVPVLVLRTGAKSVQ